MKKRSIIRTIITIVVLVGAVALIASTLKNNKKKNAEKTAVVAEANGDIAVRVTPVQKQSLALDFGVNGNFIPGQQLDFMAENSGRVTQVLVDEGSTVSKGQTLAVIKTDQLNVDLESAQANYNNAIKDKERFENAFKTGGVTQQQLDQARLALSNAEARVAQAKIKIGDAYIRSSINGVVNKRYIEPGAVVSPGTKLFELVDISRLKLQVTVNESQVANLKVGDKVKIKASVFPDKDFAGTVTFIAAKADATLSFPIEIALAANPGNQIKAGMYATAIFDFPAQAAAILVPRSAFIGSVNSNQVFVAKSDSTASLRKVIAGRVLGDKVEVLQGLQEGETVITSGQINLSEGSPITIVK
ncbi:efflux RND transporter periplasmic adaptor subunit [Paraflavitalea sp. CAU 1676]|uniref:efflux RND transporter periplasmic adaptor subunit n=1 Tax=Paraflavitalea sp. CAU 1676 TaxID=3032598 RepID=UPI0023DC2159|nr:efflux RND transporter periplasmic adaptor subunit [Paraflavitalea sp. CAU 1676]MDF2187728.1 efflux RND transporter periplasmic adaptor subunit [Paraflavitalea sp. CAU 1676]